MFLHCNNVLRSVHLLLGNSKFLSGEPSMISVVFPLYRGFRQGEPSISRTNSPGPQSLLETGLTITPYYFILAVRVRTETRRWLPSTLSYTARAFTRYLTTSTSWGATRSFKMTQTLARSRREGKARWCTYQRTGVKSSERRIQWNRSWYAKWGSLTSKTGGPSWNPGT